MSPRPLAPLLPLLVQLLFPYYDYSDGYYVCYHYSYSSDRIAAIRS